MKKFLTLLVCLLGVTTLLHAETYELVTDASTLADGDQIIIASQNGTSWVAMPAGLADAASNGKSVTVSDNVINNPSSDVAVFTLAATGDSSSPWAFKDNSSNKFFGNGTSNNALKTNATVTTGFKATINLAESKDIITFDSGTAKYLYYNATSGQDRFRVFKSQTGDAYLKPQIFKLKISDPNKEDPGLSWSETSVTVTIGNVFTAPTLNNENNIAVTYSSSDTSVATISTAGVVEIVSDGTTEISASFAGNETFLAATVTYTLKVVDPTNIKDVITVSNPSITATYKDYELESNGIKYVLYAYNTNGIQFNANSGHENSGLVITENANDYVLNSLDFVFNKLTTDVNIIVVGSNTAFTGTEQIKNGSLGGEEIAKFTNTDLNNNKYSITPDKEYKYIAIYPDKKGVIQITSMTFNWKPATPVTTETHGAFTFHSEMLHSGHETNHVAQDADGNWVANNIVLDDETDYVSPYNVTATKFSHTRTITNECTWHAVYLPFDIAAEKWGEFAFRAVEFDDLLVDGENISLVFTEVPTTSKLEAHKIYLLEVLETINFEADNHELKGIPTENASVTKVADGVSVTLSGTYTTKDDMYETEAYALANGVFMKAASATAKLKPYRAYLTINRSKMSAPARIGVVIDGETGINDVSIDAVKADGTTYNMLGVKVENVTSGIYVRGGKKIYVK